jgi:uncharacterized iron-regulated protein
MKKFILNLVVCSIFFSSNGQTLDAYSIYKGDGESTSFYEMKKMLGDKDIILFGELHDNPIAHWLQLELCIALFEVYGDKLVLGAEMFETDNQLIIDEYFKGLITQGRFEDESRLWNNYKTDYKPIVEYARDNKLKFVATNIPRRYASMVSSGGFEALDALTVEAKRYIAPLPVDYDPELPGYKAMLTMMGMPGKGGADNQNFPKAQAIKDATMAWNILQNFKQEHIFLHFHGTYHSNNYEGIVWYLRKYNSTFKISTIATVLQDGAEKLEEANLNLADFIIVVPKRMTRTY